MASNQHLVSQAELLIQEAQETHEFIINPCTAAIEAVTTASFISIHLHSLRHFPEIPGQELLKYTKEQKRSYKRYKES